MEAKKQEELDKMTQAQRIKWNEDMREQLVQLELKKQAIKEEELNERLWVKRIENFYPYLLSGINIKIFDALLGIGTSRFGGTG